MRLLTWLIQLVKCATGSKMAFLRGLPISFQISNGKQLNWRKIFRRFFCYFRINRTIVVFRRDSLTFFRIQMLQIGFSYFFCTMFFATFSTTAIGGSARIETDGVTNSNCPLPISFSDK